MVRAASCAIAAAGNAKARSRPKREADWKRGVWRMAVLSSMRAQHGASAARLQPDGQHGKNRSIYPLARCCIKVRPARTTYPQNRPWRPGKKFLNSPFSLLRARNDSKLD